MKIKENLPIIAVLGTVILGGLLIGTGTVKEGSLISTGQIVEEPEIQLPKEQPENKAFVFKDFSKPFPNNVNQGETVTAKLSPLTADIEASVSGRWVAYIDVADSPSMIKLDEGNFEYSSGSGPLVIIDAKIPVKPNVNTDNGLLGSHKFVVYAEGRYDTGEKAFISNSYNGEPAPFESEVFIEEEVKKDSDGDGVINENDDCPNTGDQGNGIKSNGCPRQDSDGDNVLNFRDECPNKYGTKDNGCRTLIDQILSVFGLLR